MGEAIIDGHRVAIYGRHTVETQAADMDLREARNKSFRLRTVTITQSFSGSPGWKR
jgi:hypothetical protein